MLQHQIHADLNALTHQLVNLKDDMDKAIRNGSSFSEVKMIHLQIKELTRLIQGLRERESNEQGVKRAN